MSFKERPRQTAFGSQSDTATKLIQAFGNSPFAAIRELVVAYHEGVVTIRGTVPNFYTRQVALALVRQVASVEIINDHIQVHAKE